MPFYLQKQKKTKWIRITVWCHFSLVNVCMCLRYLYALVRVLLLARHRKKFRTNNPRDNLYITFKSDVLLEYSWSIIKIITIIIATVKCTLIHSMIYTTPRCRAAICSSYLIQFIFLLFFVISLYSSHRIYLFDFFPVHSRFRSIKFHWYIYRIHARKFSILS